LAERRCVQALRGWACLMVVCYHCLQVTGGSAAIAAWPNLSAGVDVFFVISGFVMVTSSARLAGAAHPARVFLARRAVRIVPLYWVLTALKLAVVAALPAATRSTAPNAWNIAASFLFIPSRNALGVVRPVLPVGWTLEFEVFFYLLFAAALALRLRLVWVVVGLAGVAAAGFWRQAWWPAPCVLLNGMVLEFAGGMGLAWLAGQGWKLPRRLGGVLISAGMLALLVLPLAGPWRCAVWGIPAVMVVAGALSVEGVRVPRWVVAVGDASYAIYLVHPFVVPALGGWLAVPASICAGMLADRLLDRPLRALLSADRAIRPQPQKFFGSFFQKRTALRPW